MKTHITPEQYLELDRKAEFKSEYYVGELAPAGAPDWVHSIIAANVVRELSTRLRDRTDAVCPIGASVLAGSSVLVPDALVVCGRPEFVDQRQDTLLNPTLVVEVSTPATAVADGDRKFDLYGSIPSVQEYVWIAAERIDARVFSRRPDGRWLLAIAHTVEHALTLESLNMRLRLEDIYHKVELSDADVGVGYMRPLQS